MSELTNYEMVLRTSYEDYASYCKAFILGRLNEMEGDSVESSSLPEEITRYAILDGTATFNKYEAQCYIRRWDYEAGLFLDHILRMGVMDNPFSQPESFHIRMVEYGVRQLLDKITLPVATQWVVTKELIEITANKLSEIKDIVF